MIECLVGVGLVSICVLVVMAYQSYKQDHEIRLDKMYLFQSSDKKIDGYKPKIKMEYQSHNGMREIDNDDNSDV